MSHQPSDPTDPLDAEAIQTEIKLRLKQTTSYKVAKVSSPLCVFAFLVGLVTFIVSLRPSGPPLWVQIAVGGLAFAFLIGSWLCTDWSDRIKTRIAHEATNAVFNWR